MRATRSSRRSWRPWRSRCWPRQSVSPIAPISVFRPNPRVGSPLRRNGTGRPSSPPLRSLSVAEPGFSLLETVLSVALSGALVAAAAGLSVGCLDAGRRVLAECRRTLSAARLSRELSRALAAMDYETAMGEAGIELVDGSLSLTRAGKALLRTEPVVSRLSVARGGSGRALGLEVEIEGAGPDLRLFAPFRSGTPPQRGLDEAR